MVDLSSKDMQVALLLSDLTGICDRGFALAVHIRYTRPTLLYQAYDQTWVDHYSERGYMLSDPTVHWGLANVGSIDWDQLLDQDSAGVIADAVSHGLTHGWTCSVGPATSRSMGSMTRTTAFSDAQRARCIDIVTEIHNLTEGFDTFPAAVQNRLRAVI